MIYAVGFIVLYALAFAWFEYWPWTWQQMFGRFGEGWLVPKKKEPEPTLFETYLRDHMEDPEFAAAFEDEIQRLRNRDEGAF